MTLEWLLRAVAAGALLVIAALAAERVAGWFGRPRRWVWAAAMAGMLLLTVLPLAAPGALPRIALPASSQAGPAAGPLPAPGLAAMPRMIEEAVQSAAAARPLPRAFLLGWLVASLGMLSAMVWSLTRLYALHRRCVPGEVDGAGVLLSDEAGPLVLGVLRPAVVLPRWVLAAPPEERRLIVAHERAHVAGRDPCLLALAAAAVAVVPWHPALRVLHRRLRLAVETDCDARVLAEGASRRLYGRMLLRTAGHPFSFSALAPRWGERSSHLERRIVAMTTPPPAHRLLRAVPLAALAAALGAGACAVSSRDTPPADGDRIVGASADAEYATAEFSDGTGIAVQRQPPDSTRGYIGLELGGERLRWEVRDGRRVRLPLQGFPLVYGVETGSPAERAGLRVGDEILAVDGRDARQPSPSVQLRPGEESTYRVRRAGRELELRVVAAPLSTRPWPPTEEELRRIHRSARAALAQQP